VNLKSPSIKFIHADSDEIQVLLESSTRSSDVLRVHSELSPIGVNVNGNDLARYETDGQNLLDLNNGWKYQSGNQILMVKVTTDNSDSTISLEYAEEQVSKDPKSIDAASPLLSWILAAVGLGIAVVFIHNFQNGQLSSE